MKIIKSKDSYGNIKEYQVILTYYSDEYNKDYIVYTDNKYNDNNELQIYINSYDKDTVKEIEDRKEYKKIKTIINSILLSIKNEDEKLESNDGEIL